MRPDICYDLRNRAGQQQRIPLHLHPDDHSLQVPADFEAPHWARLEYHQCSHCPLSQDEYRDCPVARNLAWLLPDHELGPSHERIDLRVDAHQRRYQMETSLQRALGSLFGLVCALSDCPHTRFLRPMALFHLPVSNETETLVRTASLYLLQRYIAHRHDPAIPVDLDELNEQYRQLNVLNRCFVERFRGRQSDAPVNAMVLLQVLSRDMKGELNELLESLAPLFDTGDAGAAITEPPGND
ncbi:hypothetical protein A11A3_09325 [Alcanivorax hongdengensis A-11-3]|uniref:Uncharacterized protein n=1 Tax=Alcanivorax hongdengensis A-11-3 TaxID=1177179 RepID=L0WF26_9GAMM|nr:hypothetical protein [Alcanivorax hongdengensis]EKF74390.1 hypothetical protein A11A3_09325 [Alcanivorax hongdengensis A-11-3]